MPKYRKRPVIIDAILWSGDNEGEIWAFFTPEISCSFSNNTFYISTIEGTMEAPVGTWIIRGIEGEFYPCKPSIFDLTYERVENDQANPSIM